MDTEHPKSQSPPLLQRGRAREGASPNKVKKQKLLKKLLSGSNNIRFSEVVECARIFGFVLSRISSSHHIYIHPETKKMINLQDLKGKAKPYQVKQLLQLIERYNLQREDKK